MRPRIDAAIEDLERQLGRIGRWEWLGDCTGAVQARALLTAARRWPDTIGHTEATDAMVRRLARATDKRLFHYLPRGTATVNGPALDEASHDPESIVVAVLEEAASLVERQADAADRIGPRDTDPAIEECRQWAETGLQALGGMRHRLMAGAAAGESWEKASEEWASVLDDMLGAPPLVKIHTPSLRTESKPVAAPLVTNGLWAVSRGDRKAVAWASRLCTYALEAPGLLTASIIGKHMRLGQPDVVAMQAMFDAGGAVSNFLRRPRELPGADTGPGAYTKYADLIRTCESEVREALHITSGTEASLWL